MRNKIKLNRFLNVFMFVMLLLSIFAQPVYGATEVASELSSQISESQEKEVEKEEEVSEEKKEEVSEEVDSEVAREEETNEANAPPVGSEEIDEVTTLADLSYMTSEELEEYFDDESNEVLFIDTTNFELPESYAYSIEATPSPVDLSVFNSSMWGEWSIYRVNGKYVYCIEPGVNTTSSASSSSESGSIYARFSTTTKRQISRIISSSQQHYKDSGNTDWLYAGQMMIWSYLAIHEESLMTHSYGTYDAYASSRYSSEVTAIQNELDEWTVRPSFMGSTSSTAKGHTLNYNESTDQFELTLKDTNGVWDSKFADYGDFGSYVVSNPAGSDNVKIVSKSAHTSYTSARTYTWTPYASGEALFYDAGQDLAYVGSDPLPAYMKFKTETTPLGGIKAKKVDSETGAGLQGAVFKIYEDPNNNDKIDSGESVVATVTSNASGIISTGKTLIAGDYTAKESKAPTGYVKSNTVHSLHVNANEITDYTSKPWENDIIRGGFTLTKLGEVYGLDPEALADIEFTVTSSTYPSLSKVYTTDSNGNIVTDADELSVGDYHISETKAPSKYVMNYEEDFSITKDGVIVQLNGGKDIVNELYMNKVHGRKTAQSLDNNDKTVYPLAGATFGIYQDIGDTNETVDRQDILVDIQVTDENGEFTSVELQEGNYYLKEIEAPTGYNLNETTYPFTVTNDGSLEDGAVIDLGNITNEVITGTADLIKVGSKECDKALAKPNEIKDCQTVLSNVSFAIYQDLNNDGEWGKGEDNPIQVMTTNEEGVATTEALKYGTYFAKEINNPRDNYFMNDNVFTFNITNQDEVVHINNGVAIENIEKLGQIHISKTGNSLDNLDDTIVAVAGAEYTIFDSEGKEVEVMITDEEGMADSGLLSFGDYTFKETKAPVGYALDEAVYKFTIDEDTYIDTINFDLTDEVLTSDITLTKVDSVTRKHLEGAEFEILTKDSSGKYVNYNVEGTNFVTDNDGYINLEQTPYGEYALREIKAPDGYLLNDELIPFEVTEDGATIELTFPNTREELAVTGSSVGRVLIGAVIVLVTLTVIKTKVLKTEDELD